MTKTAEINARLLEDLPVLRLPKVVPPGGWAVHLVDGG